MSSQDIHIESLTVATSDRSFNYGDGCFTTMLCVNGKIEYLDVHLRRLEIDSRQLLFPALDINAIKQAISDFSQTLHQMCVVKVHVSRGNGGRGYALPKNAKISIHISSHSFTPSNTEAIHLGIANIRLSSQPMLAGIKHCNRLEQILAKSELSHTSFDDLIMCDEDDNIVEVTSSNIFVFIDQCWVTPSLDRQGVNGVMRQVVIQQMEQQGMDIVETRIPLQQLAQAQSVFVTNAVLKIRPVKSIDIGTKVVSFDTLPCSHVVNAIN